jgi:alpha-ketoglutarate-dependent taurine dioxygenase
MIEQEITGPIAWCAEELPHDPGVIQIDEEALEEIVSIAIELDANPLPLEALRPEDFELHACRALMAKVKHQVEDGIGFAIIDRLPIDQLGQQARAVYWLLASMVQRPVAQKWDGLMIYDVTDAGKPPGNGVRPDKTNAEQNYHTDNSYNLCPPNIVGLLCMRPARDGGVSHVVSFASAHNRLRETAPDLLARLYEPFAFDRQREHAADDVKFLWHSCFEEHHGQLLGRLSRFQVKNGYPLAGAEIDQRGLEALEALEEAMNAPGMPLAFHFEPGQIQLVNNRLLGHRRTGFTDWPEPDRKRLLVRLWLRDWGRPFYNG